MANDLILARKHEIFAVEETTAGTLVFPSATDLVIPAGNGTIGQVPTYTDSEEINNSRSLMDQFTDALPAGDWTCPMYLRPSGSAGSVPQGAALFKALFGTETITASTSVAYTLALALPSLSLWYRYGDVIFFAAGATADQMKFGVTRKGAVRLEFSGKFMNMGWAGVDALSSSIDGTSTPVTSLPVNNAKRYSVGARIQVGTNTNSGNGFEVTAVDTSSNTLTVSPGVDTAESSGTEVKGYLPTGTETGSPVESRTFSASFDGGTTNKPLTGLDLTFVNGVQYMEDEITDADHPVSFVEGGRRVSGNCTLLFREDDVDYFYNSYNNQTVDMRLSCGSGAGSTVRFDMDVVRLSMPRVNPQSPTVALAMDFTAIASSGEDEISMTLT